MSKLMMSIARRVPREIRESILQEGLIDKAVSTMVVNSPMEYLFDVHAAWLDPNKEFGEWDCARCREHVLAEWRKLKPYLENLEMLNQ